MSYDLTLDQLGHVRFVDAVGIGGHTYAALDVDREISEILHSETSGRLTKRNNRKA